MYHTSPGDWDPETHTFGANGSFNPAVVSEDVMTGSDYVVIENHSNAEVLPTLSGFAKNPDFGDNITAISTVGSRTADGKFQENVAITKLATADGTPVNDPPCMVYKVSLDGEMTTPEGGNDADYQVAGSYTITLATPE